MVIKLLYLLVPLLQINSATSSLQGFLSKEPNLVPKQVRTPAWLRFTVADIPCYVFDIWMLTTNKDQKYKSVELGDQLGSRKPAAVTACLKSQLTTRSQPRNPPNNRPLCRNVRHIVPLSRTYLSENGKLQKTE